MLRCIGERFLSDAVETGAEGGRQALEVAAEPDFEAGAAAAAPVPSGDQAFQAGGEPKLVDVGRPQPKQRAAQGFHHLGRDASDAVAFRRKPGIVTRRALAGRCGERADRDQALSEFVMKFACQMAALVVLQRDQPPRQFVALGERRAEAFGEVVEHVTDGGQFGEVERRQPGRQVTRGDPGDPGADQPRRAQCARQRRIDQAAQ